MMRRADAIEMALLDLLDVLEEFSSLPPGLVKEARAAVALPRQGYRRGLGRLVGNARCSECRTHQPALTCFDCDPADGSCGWMVCDGCLYKVLPLPPAAVDLARASTTILDALDDVHDPGAEAGTWMGHSRDDAREALSRLGIPSDDGGGSA